MQEQSSGPSGSERPDDGDSRRDPLEELQGRIESAFEELRPKLRRALDELDARVDSAVSELRPRFDARVQDAKPRVDRFVAEMQPRMDDLIRKVQSKLEDIRTDLQSRAARGDQQQDFREGSTAGDAPPRDPGADPSPSDDRFSGGPAGT